MTPIQLQVLLHCYYSSDPYPGPRTRAVDEAYGFLSHAKLVDKRFSVKDHTAYWGTTPRGEDMVKFMLSVPVPPILS